MSPVGAVSSRVSAVGVARSTLAAGVGLVGIVAAIALLVLRGSGSVSPLVSGTPVHSDIAVYANMSNAHMTVQLTRRKDVKLLVTALNDLPKAPTNAVSCPNDTGARDIAQFAYGGRQKEIVTIHTSGCEFVTSPGQAARSSDDSLSRLLGRLTGR